MARVSGGGCPAGPEKGWSSRLLALGSARGPGFTHGSCQQVCVQGWLGPAGALPTLPGWPGWLPEP